MVHLNPIAKMCSLSLFLSSHVRFRIEGRTFVSWGLQCLLRVMCNGSLGCLFGNMSVCLCFLLPHSKWTCHRTTDILQRWGQHEGQQGTPALCKAVSEKSVCSEAKNPWGLICGCHHYLLLVWQQGSWGRYVTCPKPHGNAVTQIQPMWMPCPVFALPQHVAYVYCFYYQNFPLPFFF